MRIHLNFIFYACSYSVSDYEKFKSWSPVIKRQKCRLAITGSLKNCSLCVQTNISVGMFSGQHQQRDSTCRKNAIILTQRCFWCVWGYPHQQDSISSCSNILHFRSYKVILIIIQRSDASPSLRSQKHIVYKEAMFTDCSLLMSKFWTSEL